MTNTLATALADAIMTLETGSVVVIALISPAAQDGRRNEITTNQTSVKSENTLILMC